MAGATVCHITAEALVSDIPTSAGSAQLGMF
jgi:hypothetical protein